MKILLVSHEASLTGAPRVAVDILEAARALFDERVVVIRWGGPLIPELAAAATRARLEPFRRLRVMLRRIRRTRRFAITLEEAVAAAVLRRERPDVVYLNTVKSACYARPALELGMRVVLHSHETGILAASTLDRYGLDGLYGRIHLVACSLAAQKDLREITRMSDVRLIVSTVDTVRVRTLAERVDLDDDHMCPPRRNENGLVVACGQANADKGTDLWLDVVAAVKSVLGARCPFFWWIGEDDGGTFGATAAHLGLQDVVQFLGPRNNPYPLLAQADVVTIPFRSGPYPLVTLEAMALDKPVVAFAVGGLTEQLGSAGGLVPPEDVKAMAEEIVRLVTDEGARAGLALRCSEQLNQLAGAERFRSEITALLGELAGSSWSDRP